MSVSTISLRNADIWKEFETYLFNAPLSPVTEHSSPPVSGAERAHCASECATPLHEASVWNALDAYVLNAQLSQLTECAPVLAAEAVLCGAAPVTGPGPETLWVPRGAWDSAIGGIRTHPGWSEYVRKLHDEAVEEFQKEGAHDPFAH